MDKTIKRIKPKYYRIVAFVLGAISMYVLLSYAQLLTTGKYVLLADDALNLYVAEIRMYMQNILHGESVWYSFANCLGMNNAAGMAGVLFSPFNLLYLIFAKADVNVITAAIVIIKTGLAAAAFQVFASKTLKIRNFYSILFAVFYSMCSFTVVYGIINIMWLDGVYILPLVALAVNRAVRESKYAMLSALYAYIFIVQYYQGFLILLFSLIYYILLLLFRTKEERKIPVGKHIFRYFLSALTSVLTAAFLLVPLFLFLRKYSTPDLSLGETQITFMQLFNNLFWGEHQDFTLAPYVYCGIPVLILVPFYFMNRKIPGKERTVYGILTAFFAAGCIFPPLLAFLQAFQMPDLWNYRFSFILSFLFCVTACKEAVYIKRIRLKDFLIYGGFLIVFYLFEGRLERLEIGSMSQNSLFGFIVNIAWIAVWAAFTTVYVKSAKNRMTVAVLFIFLALAECVTNGYMWLSSDEWHDVVERENNYYAWAGEMDYIGEETRKANGRNDFYRMIVSGDYVNNSDSFTGYNGIADYGPYKNRRTESFLRDVGLYSDGERNSGTGYSLPVNMLLSVKYVARLHTDMIVLGKDVKPDIKENEYVLPIGFMVNDAVTEETEMTDNAFENQNRIFEKLSGRGPLYLPVEKDRITVEEDGLLLSDEENPVITRTDSGTGVMVFRVADTDNPVYMQISTSLSPDEEQGIYYDLSENMTFYDDNRAWIPFAAKLWQSGNNHYLSMRAAEEFPVSCPTNGVFIYELDTMRMKETADTLMTEPFVPEYVKNGHIRGRVSLTDDRRILFTSIPYDEGWTVSVNNRKAESVAVLNGTFLGIKLPDRGEYQIEMKYHCPGAGAGGIGSLVGIILLVVQFVSERKRVKAQGKD